MCPHLTSLHVLGIDIAYTTTAVFCLVCLTFDGDATHTTARYIELTGCNLGHLKGTHTRILDFQLVRSQLIHADISCTRVLNLTDIRRIYNDGDVIRIDIHVTISKLNVEFAILILKLKELDIVVRRREGHTTLIVLALNHLDLTHHMIVDLVKCLLWILGLDNVLTGF